MSAPAQTSGQSHSKTPRRGRREQTRTVALLALCVLITLFALLNLDKVKVHLIFGTGEVPLIIVIVAALLVGIVFGYIAARRGGKGQ